jgi:hypothetical protein
VELAPPPNSKEIPHQNQKLKQYNDNNIRVELSFHGAEERDIQESFKKSSFPAHLSVLHVTTHSSVSMVTEQPLISPPPPCGGNL